MRSLHPLVALATLCAIVACAADTSHGPVALGTSAPLSVNAAPMWGADSANLAVTPDSAHLRYLSDNGCVATYVDAANPAGSLSLSAPGVYTQLIGAFPGKLMYPAQVNAVVNAGMVRLTVTVPALSLVIGPTDLAKGVSHVWANCNFP